MRPTSQAVNYAGVVQLVRALACHVRSCGFEPRLPRILSKCALVIVFILSSCNSPTDYQTQAKELNQKLLEELNSIHSLEDLQRSKKQFENIYNSLADLILKADDEIHEQGTILVASEENLELSEKIQEKLYELYELDGRIKDLLEEFQNDAYIKLRKKF